MPASIEEAATLNNGVAAAKHRVLNRDLVPWDHPGVDNIIGDVTDIGQVLNVLTSCASFDELERGAGVPKFARSPVEHLEQA